MQDANVFYKANIRHNNCKTEVRCLRALQSLNKFLRDSYDSHVKRPFVLRCILNHFNMVKPEANARSPNTYGQLWPRLNVLMYINNKLVSFTLFFHNSIFFQKKDINIINKIIPVIIHLGYKGSGICIFLQCLPHSSKESILLVRYGGNI